MYQSQELTEKEYLFCNLCPLMSFLAMWGFHDHSLSMRKALNETMITSKPNNSLYRRWRWTQYVQNKKVTKVIR